MSPEYENARGEIEKIHDLQELESIKWVTEARIRKLRKVLAS